MTVFDADLISFATQRELDYIEAIKAHGSERRAAKMLGVKRGTVNDAMRRLKARAAMRHHSPEHGYSNVLPAIYTADRITAQVAGGTTERVWLKGKVDDDIRLKIIQEAFAAMSEDLPRLPPTKPVARTRADLCNLYTMTDCHLGMLAWHKEGGADWDLRIAEHTLTGCFAHLVESSPAASTAVIAQLGDWLHSDGLTPVTPTSGHVLDQDGRFSKIVQAAIRVLRRMIDLALKRHEKVVLLVAEGNHDLASSVWLRVMFQALYENEPRVSVIDSELPYYVHQHGKTMLAFHHGHLKKNDQLPLLFASQFPEVWGATRKRYAHTGHRHHVEEKEHSGMTVVQHPTLAARDAYAARGGWISERLCQSVTYHIETGKAAVTVVTPEMIEPIEA